MKLPYRKSEPTSNPQYNMANNKAHQLQHFLSMITKVIVSSVTIWQFIVPRVSIRESAYAKYMKTQIIWLLFETK